MKNQNTKFPTKKNENDIFCTKGRSTSLISFDEDTDIAYNTTSYNITYPKDRPLGRVDVINLAGDAILNSFEAARLQQRRKYGGPQVRGVPK